MSWKKAWVVTCQWCGSQEIYQGMNKPVAKMAADDDGWILAPEGEFCTDACCNAYKDKHGVKPACGRTSMWDRHDNCEFGPDEKCIHCGAEMPF